MGKIINVILFSVTLGKFLRFCFIWGIIAAGIETFFVVFLGRSLFAGVFFLILSTLALVFSYTSIGLELKENRLELNWWQVLRSIPAVVLIIWLSRYPNALSLENPQSSAIITVLIGFWSSQVAVVLRSALPI